MTPDIYAGLSRYLSVNSNSRGINPMLAPRRTLLLLADGDAALVDEYIRMREGGRRLGTATFRRWFSGPYPAAPVPGADSRQSGWQSRRVF
ncbi:MAG: hypothetical protein R3E89_13225 [Thiolinea sp.]